MNGNQNYRERRYRDDTVFQKINKKYLTLPEDERRINNEHLKRVVEQVFIPLMKRDELFAVMYRRIMYGGSYYKGTRYGRAEEFDLDFVIKLPIKYTKIRIDTNHNNYGFVKVKLDTQEQMTPAWEKHRKILSSWLSPKNYLDQNKFRQWMERIFTSAFMALDRTPSGYYRMQCDGQTYEARHKKSGPAFTMIITTPNGSMIDVDLVPCLEFDDVPLGNGYRKFIGTRKTWMAVAKPLSNEVDHNILWRLCFYEQEREMLEGDIKPVIRMMKKFRDTKGWKSIASYYIETLFYHELVYNQNDLRNYLRAPKTWLFMHGLKKLKEAFETQKLPYFWHSGHNLLGKIKSVELQGYANHLARLITQIDNNIETDRFILADVVLTANESRAIRMVPDQNQQTGRDYVIIDEPRAVPQEAGGRCIIA